MSHICAPLGEVGVSVALRVAGPGSRTYLHEVHTAEGPHTAKLCRSGSGESVATQWPTFLCRAVFRLAGVDLRPLDGQVRSTYSQLPKGSQNA